MAETIEAMFDGHVFRPIQLVNLKANTQVKMTVGPIPAIGAKPTSFLQTAKKLNIDGPPDWSAKVDDYLYAKEVK